MRLSDLSETKKGRKPRPSQTLELDDSNNQFKKDLRGKPQSVLDTVYDFVNLYLRYKQNPNDMDLLNEVNGYRIHPIPKFGTTTADITDDLRLHFRVENGFLRLVRLTGHDYYKKRR